ncbi:MAG: redoxin domain-containing protein [Cytophagales bacterium]|nr:redoxin domain-containing protein [Cytophagales bacterium]
MKNFVLSFLLLLAVEAGAQELKDFTLLNTQDGKSISLSSFKNNAGVLVIFTSHECPFDNYYKDRIKELAGEYVGKVQVVLINSNQEPQESKEQMAIHYKDLNVPYLADKDQVAMELFGARRSPEAFLLSTVNSKFSVVYSGAIDDNPQLAKDVKQSFLKEAIDKLLAGQKIEPANQRASGCTIRRK